MAKIGSGLIYAYLDIPNRMKKALITGIAGQDGSYLAELLLEKGYTVHGLVRSISQKLNHIRHLYDDQELKDRFFLHKGDLCDSSSLAQMIKAIQPDEIYNLASISHMQATFDMPEQTADVAAMGVLRLLEAVRIHCPHARVYQASSSELFGNVKESPQHEKTPFQPSSLYGAAKLYAYWAVAHYRNTHRLFACSGILFNHESPRRGENFISRKITLAAARIRAGIQERLILGNLDAKRDWGYAKDFVEGMWRIVQQKIPEDFILATGKVTAVRKFVELAFLELGTQIIWEGKGIAEKGRDLASGRVIIEVSPDFFRPLEDSILVGNPTKAKLKLGWSATTPLEKLVQIMVKADSAVVLKNLSLR